MDVQTEIAFWFVVTVCLAGPVGSWFRLRTVPPGWCAAWGAILVVAVAGRLLESPATILAALALWGLLVAVPAALGAARFLAVYLVAGVGSMAAVVAAAGLRGEPCVCVGASGAVMGIVGGTAAMMLRGWRRERADVARGRGLLMVGFVVMQAAIDAVVPQMSSTGHLAGAALGFLATLVAGDRLRR